MPTSSRIQQYGRDFKSFVVSVSPEDHQAAKIRSAQFGVTISDVCRAALANDQFWTWVAKQKQAAEQAR